MPAVLLISSNFGFPFLHNRFFAAPLKLWQDSHVCFSSPPSDNNPLVYGTQEEGRWLREEQRWLREEQRWLREEQRWKEERRGLIQEINSLKIRLQELEQLSSVSADSVSETVQNIAKLIQVLKEGDLGKTVNRITESGSSSVPLIVEAAVKFDEVVVKEVISVPDKKGRSNRRTLRSGSEGDDVRAMQEALQKLGFYSGEEDIEFASFSTGTERAVKTWQATKGASEDGIMTAELLEQLYMEHLGKFGPEVTKNIDSKASDPTKIENGAPAPLTTIRDTSEVQKPVITEKGDADDATFKNRVFLLGENRWEEPSRLSRDKNQVGPPKAESGNSATKCLLCRGEGHILCMECDGTGEPNVEPQFLEWIDEGAKCPYCEGLGYTVCDACVGKNST